MHNYWRAYGCHWNFISLVFLLLSWFLRQMGPTIKTWLIPCSNFVCVNASLGQFSTELYEKLFQCCFIDLVQVFRPAFTQLNHSHNFCLKFFIVIAVVLGKKAEIPLVVLWRCLIFMTCLSDIIEKDKLYYLRNIGKHETSHKNIFAKQLWRKVNLEKVAP